MWSSPTLSASCRTCTGPPLPEALPGANSSAEGIDVSAQIPALVQVVLTEIRTWGSTNKYQGKIASDKTLERKTCISDLLHNVAYALYILDLILLAIMFESLPKRSLAKTEKQTSKLPRPLT